MNITPLFHDLAIILMVAAATTLIFKWLKQPVVLGYIVAGIITGAHGLDIVTVDSKENIELWGEIGVVFLLFALGLQFNIKKLGKVGSTGAITVFSELIVMFCVGFLCGYLMGWNTMDCVFLGSMLTVSSTTIVIKAFDELGLRKHDFTNVVFGVLVIEDVVAVLQLVLLSTIIIGSGFSGGQLMFTSSNLFMFIVFFFVLGIYIIPTFFKMSKKIISEENLLLIATGLCFGMVFLTDKFDYSAALGAFLMGTIISETLESEKIFKLISPLKYLFGAIFFVSVGMLVDFSVVGSNIFPIVAITLLVLLVKPFSVATGVLISGQPLKTAIQSGASMGQIGEFSFIIATLGLKFEIIDPMLYPIIVSVSVITTFVTPYSMKFAEPLYCNVPLRLKNMLERSPKAPKPHSLYKTALKKSIKKYIFSSLIFISILAFMAFLSIYALKPFLEQFLPSAWADIVSFTATLLIMLPVLWVLIAEKMSFRENYNRIWRKKTIHRIILLILILLRFSIVLFFVVFLITHYFHFNIGISLIITTIFAVFITLTQKRINDHFKIEERFFQNMNLKTSIPEIHIPENLAHDLRMETMTVSESSEVIGKTLEELDCCEQFGVNVISIMHNNNRYDLPSGKERLYPNDKLLVAGYEEYLKLFKFIVEKEENFELKQANMNVYHVLLSPQSSLIGKSLNDVEFRQKHNCMVICISRNNNYLMNPPSSTILQEGDLLWIIGEVASVLRLEGL